MENQKQKNSVGTILLVILLLIVTITSLILATYAWAKYTTTKSGEASVKVAQWDVDFSGTQTNHSFQHVVANRLAPGTSGQFAMEITSANTEVAYDYVIAIKNLVNKPTNLKWYSAATYDSTTGVYTFAAADEITNLDSFFAGHVSLNASDKAVVYENGKSATPTIYWYWPYETTTGTVATMTIPANSPASKENMAKAMIDLANSINIKNGEDAKDFIADYKEANSIAAGTALTDAQYAEVADAALTDAKRTTKPNPAGEGTVARTVTVTATNINDAIDTAEGMTAPTMEFDAEFTATQTTPVAVP